MIQDVIDRQNVCLLAIEKRLADCGDRIARLSDEAEKAPYVAMRERLNKAKAEVRFTAQGNSFDRYQPLLQDADALLRGETDEL